jgi:hypothetical protein
MFASSSALINKPGEIMPTVTQQHQFQLNTMLQESLTCSSK